MRLGKFRAIGFAIAIQRAANCVMRRARMLGGVRSRLPVPKAAPGSCGWCRSSSQSMQGVSRSPWVPGGNTASMARKRNRSSIVTSFRHVRVVMTDLSIEPRKVVRGPRSQVTPATRGRCNDRHDLVARIVAATPSGATRDGGQSAKASRQRRMPPPPSRRTPLSLRRQKEHDLWP
jgi:hypothetical protein